MPQVILYSRPGCHLCDDAREAIEALAASGVEFELREVNIETDDRLHAAYLERIPVVELEGELVSELRGDAEALRVALGGSRPTQGSIP